MADNATKVSETFSRRSISFFGSDQKELGDQGRTEVSGFLRRLRLLAKAEKSTFQKLAYGKSGRFKPVWLAVKWCITRRHVSGASHDTGIRYYEIRQCWYYKQSGLAQGA